MNAGANAFGNHDFPVNVATVLALKVAVKLCGSEFRIVCIGLYPRNAEKRADVGAICRKTDAPSWGAPAAAAAFAKYIGREPERVRITVVKSILVPMLVPVFISVLLIPAAAPLFCGGTEFMMDAMLGEENIPIPIPIAKTIAAKSG